MPNTKQPSANSTPANNKTQQDAHQQQPDVRESVAENDSFVIKFSWDKVQPIYQAKLKKMAQNLKLKGFRKGKTPLNLAEKELNQEQIVNSVLKELLPQAYQAGLKKGKFLPISDPEFQAISLNKDNDWEIKAVFAQKPKINLTGYAQVVKKAKAKAKKEIAKYNQQAQAQKDAKKTDTSKTKKNDSVDKKAQAPTQPLSQQQQDDTLMQAIFAELVQTQKPKVPELLIKQNTQQEIQNLTQRLKELNITVEDFLKARNLTQDQLTMQMAYSSLNQLQVEFLLNAIAEQEKITVTAQEVTEKLQKIEDEATRAKMKQDANYQIYLKATIVKQKAIKYLLDL